MDIAFGIFDSFDRGGRDPGAVIRDRLDFAVAAERIGIDHYHVTEHHGTPLSVIPSPNLFLAALAQRTTTMRMGALVYVLPMYHPLRLAEEVATLDQLTGGRIDLGVGRGISPYELQFFDVAGDDARAVFDRGRAQLLQALESGVHTAANGAEAHLSVRPVQQPHPPLWYASTTPATAEWAGAQGVSLVARWNSGQLVQTAGAFWDAYDAAGRPGGTPRIGPSTTIYIGETDDAAMEGFLRVGLEYTNDLLALWRENDNAAMEANFNLEAMIGKGNAIVGSVDTVAAEVLRQVSEAPINYFEANIAYGSMTGEEAIRNLEGFGEVMSRVRASVAAPEGASA